MDTQTSELDGPDSDLELDSGDEEDEVDEEIRGNSQLEDTENDPLAQNHFEWKKEDPSNVQFRTQAAEFTEPEETFNLERNGLEMGQTPFQTLKYFLSPVIITEILSQTNDYAEILKMTQPSTLKTWKRVTEPEWWKFWGLHLLMGLVKKNTINDYWSKNPLLSTPVFGKTMSRDRFQQILRCFHLANNFLDKDPNNKLWKLGSLVSRLKTQFQSLINLGEYLSVDESLLPFKGRLGFKQYNPLKRARFGIKYFGIVDCQTKYLTDFEIYVGKCTEAPSSVAKLVGLGGSVVLKLMQPYLNRSHKLVVDNWFNSPALQVELLNQKTYCLGTTRPDRKNMPKFEVKLNKIADGACEIYSTDSLLLERWKDRRQVCMLSTFMDHEMIMSQGRAFNRRLKPKSVLTYNTKMNGMDHIDQLMAPYESLRKTLKWYKKLSFHLFDLCVYNSCVLYNHLNPTKNLKYKDYVMQLITELISQEPAPLPLRQSTNTLHLPVKQKFQDCYLCKTVENKRKQTLFRCSGCNKQLCINKENNCFKKYHEEPLPKRRRSNPLEPSDSENCFVSSGTTASGSGSYVHSQLESDSLLYSYHSFFTCDSGHEVIPETQESQETNYSESLLAN